MIRFLKFLTLFIAIGAVWGAAMMWIDPTGAMWGMEPILETLRAKMPWPDIFFRDFIPSGIVLLIVNGLTQFAAAYLLFRTHRFAFYAVLICGIILMLWISLEWWLWGFNAICNIYFLFGLIEALCAIYCIKRQYFSTR